MRKIYLFLGILLMASANVWGSYYCQGEVYARPEGGGKVYVSQSVASLDDCTEPSKTTKWGSQNNHQKNVEVTFYAYAKPENTYRFLGWKSTDSEEAEIVSTVADGYVFTGRTENNDQGGTTYAKRYAYFEKVESISDAQTAEEMNALLSDINGMTFEELAITRPVYRNTHYNTLCLPFAMDADQIAASSLAGAEIKEFTGASVVGDELRLDLSPVSEIEAGKPYFIKYSNADALSQLDFEDVTVNAADPQAVEFNGVRLQGTYVPFEMSAQSELDYNGGYVFLGQNDQLFWPGDAGTIKPFRAYFHVDINSGSAGAPMRRGMPAVFNEVNTTTDVENVQGNKVQSTKLIENGQVIIIRNGVRYNAAGQIVK